MLNDVSGDEWKYSIFMEEFNSLERKNQFRKRNEEPLVSKSQEVTGFKRLALLLKYGKERQMALESKDGSRLSHLAPLYHSKEIPKQILLQNAKQRSPNNQNLTENLSRYSTNKRNYAESYCKSFIMPLNK